MRSLIYDRVWPAPEGEVRGESFSPLYQSVPEAAKKVSVFYEWLTLVDALRGGKAREKDFAKKEIEKGYSYRVDIQNPNL